MLPHPSSNSVYRRYAYLALLNFVRVIFSQNGATACWLAHLSFCSCETCHFLSRLCWERFMHFLPTHIQRVYTYIYTYISAVSICGEVTGSWPSHPLQYPLWFTVGVCYIFVIRQSLNVLSYISIYSVSCAVFSGSIYCICGPTVTLCYPYCQSCVTLILCLFVLPVTSTGEWVIQYHQAPV